MDSLNQLDNMVDILMCRYQHIIGEQNGKNISSEQLIENIVSYYEDIINCMPGNVYWLDKNGFAIGCNQNVLDMFGFKSLAEFKGLSFEKMGREGHWTPEATQAFKNDTLEVVTTGQSKLNIEEPPIPHRDGRIIHFLTSRVPLFDQFDNVIGVVGISVDITELKQTQAALKKAKEAAEAASYAKSEFVANMSHDIKTPLTGIMGMAELLTYRLKGEDQEFAQTLLLSGRQLLNFFDNCLEVFKLESSEIALANERFSLKEVLNEINDLFQPAIKKKGLLFSIHYHDHVPDDLIGSRVGLYRVLLNLVGNAVKFTHHGSVIIDISLNKRSMDDEAFIMLKVKDTGIGIAKNKHQIIFDRFTRLIPSYKGTYEGNGIGLYVVRKFLQAMNGQIYVESEEGHGSQFTVILPFAIPQSNTIDKKKEAKSYLDECNSVIPAALPTAAPKKLSAKILLVEDNLTTQLIQSSLLTSMYCEVDVVATGEKALDIFEPGKYDLIFMDIGLPGMQGDMVSRLIRKMEYGSRHHVPIIALTAHTSEEEDTYYLTAGMQGRFSKPLSREQARQIINEYCLST